MKPSRRFTVLLALLAMTIALLVWDRANDRSGPHQTLGAPSLEPCTDLEYTDKVLTILDVEGERKRLRFAPADLVALLVATPSHAMNGVEWAVGVYRSGDRAVVVACEATSSIVFDGLAGRPGGPAGMCASRDVSAELARAVATTWTDQLDHVRPWDGGPRLFVDATKFTVLRSLSATDSKCGQATGPDRHTSPHRLVSLAGTLRGLATADGALRAKLEADVIREAEVLRPSVAESTR